MTVGDEHPFGEVTVGVFYLKVVDVFVSTADELHIDDLARSTARIRLSTTAMLAAISLFQNRSMVQPSSASIASFRLSRFRCLAVWSYPTLVDG